MEVIYVASAVISVIVSWMAVKLLLWWRGFAVYRKAALQLPHDPVHWLFGNLHDHPGSVGDAVPRYWIDMTRRYPEVYSYMWGPVPSVTVTSPHTAKLFMKTSTPKGIHYGFFKEWLGDGLLLSSGSKWFRNRKLLTPAFHFDVLRPYIQIKNEAADQILEDLNAGMSQTNSVDVYHHVNACTMDVMLRCALSYEREKKKDSEDPYCSAIQVVQKMLIIRILNIFYHSGMIFHASWWGWKFRRNVKYAHDVCYRIINTRRRALIESGGTVIRKNMDFLDILLLARDEDGEGMSDEEIRSEMDTFLFEGHDTTASGISWALHTLAAHPEHQARVQREVDGLLRGRSPPHLTWDDMNSLPYLTLCIKECLRINPPVPFVAKQTIADTEVNGVILPTGAELVVSIYGIHHNPKVWGDNHEEFIPERFLPENINKMDSFSFIPFSAGPRNCIGQQFAMNELKIIIARILYGFQLKLDPSRPAEHVMEFIMRSKNGINLILTPRELLGSD